MAVKVVPGQILFGVDAGAAVVGISPRLFWAFIEAGEIKIVKIGTRTLVHAEAVVLAWHYQGLCLKLGDRKV